MGTLYRSMRLKPETCPSKRTANDQINYPSNAPRIGWSEIATAPGSLVAALASMFVEQQRNSVCFVRLLVGSAS